MMPVSYDFVFLAIALLLFGIRFVYWKVTEVKADREKPRKEQAYSPKRMFTTGIALIVFLQIIGIQILPFTSTMAVQAIGLFLVIVGFAISMEARRILGTNWAHAAEYQIKKNHELITAGIYKYIRHPIYLGFLFSLIGIELILSSYLSLLFMLLAIPIMNFQASNEEKILTAHFGEKYKNYKKRTFRFVPFVW